MGSLGSVSECSAFLAINSRARYYFLALSYVVIYFHPRFPFFWGTPSTNGATSVLMTTVRTNGFTSAATALPGSSPDVNAPQVPSSCHKRPAQFGWLLYTHHAHHNHFRLAVIYMDQIHVK